MQLAEMSSSWIFLISDFAMGIEIVDRKSRFSIVMKKVRGGVDLSTCSSHQNTSSTISTIIAPSRIRNIFLLESKKNLFFLSSV